MTTDVVCCKASGRVHTEKSGQSKRVSSRWATSVARARSPDMSVYNFDGLAFLDRPCAVRAVRLIDTMFLNRLD